MLLALLALVVIAGALWYTASQRESEPGYSGRDEAVGSEPTKIPPNPVYDEATPAAEPRNEPSAAEAAAFERAPSEPAEEPDVDTAEPPNNEAATPANETSALTTVRSFYAALGSGDGASAAQLVVPAKRQSGPLSAGALSRYYSSFRRPLRVRRVSPVDANTVRVAYDYVLADGRLCEGRAVANVVQSGDRTLVSSIRTQGPC
jgi:hypothetical protein